MCTANKKIQSETRPKCGGTKYNMWIDKSKFLRILKVLLIGLLVVIGTFPENDWSFSVGIDPPLSWAFNYIYENGLSLGQHIIFPHGPLAFFMYPLPNNILIVTLATSLLKIMLVFNVVNLLGRKESYSWLIAFSFAYIVSLIAGFNQLIFANIVLLYCNYYNQQKISYKLLAFVLTAFAFFIKSNIAIISGIVCISFVLYNFIKYKNYKKTGADIVTIIGLLFLFWFIMYGTFGGLISYTVGMFQLAKDNSSAAAYYPHNNWWVLSAFIIIVLILPFGNRTRKSYFFGIITTLSLFAVWKHGMAREDIYHVYDLLTYVFILFSTFILFQPSHLFGNIVLSAIALLLLEFNMQNAANYESIKFEIFQAHNFVEFCTDFSGLKAKSLQETQKNISSNKLPQSIRDSIAGATVDIYPWDYSIISANNLKWKPRVVIQSYAAYTSWLDNKNAEHFASENAPDYIIWELDKVTEDCNGSSLNSIDNRYLLNDEPLSFVQVLKNYQFYSADSKFLVLKKRTKPIDLNASLIGQDKSKWGEWINVPNSSNALLRAKLTFKKSFFQRLKAFFYKDEQFWIYLKFQNGLIHKYRIVPENARNGIWVNPYILNASQIYSVRQIMFKCSNQNILTENLDVQWEKTECESESNFVTNFFNLNNSNSGQTLLTSPNTFESPENPYWNKLEGIQTSEVAHSGKKSHLVKPNSFSATFRYQLDSLSYGNVKINTDCWVKSPGYNYSRNISLILAITDSSGNIVWKGQSIDEQLIDRTLWNNIQNFTDYEHNRPGCTLSVYVWNLSHEDVFLDDFRVMITTATNLDSK